MATYAFELNAKPARDGRNTVFLRITHQRRHRRTKTGISLKPAEFNKTGGYGKWVRSVHPSHKQLNSELKVLMRRAEEQDATRAAATNGPDLPCEVYTLSGYSEKIIEEAAVNSVGHQRILTSRLRMFVGFAGPDRLLSSIDLDTLNRFKRHLQATGHMESTQHSYFTKIKFLFTQALNHDLIDRNPFRLFDMPAERAAPRLKLSDEQVRIMEGVDVATALHTRGRNYTPSTWLHRAKWLYLFAYQMGGIRSRDVLQLRWGNLIIGESGSTRLDYQMSKTGESMSVKVTPAAARIIDLFRPTDYPPKPADYLFGVLDSTAPYARALTHEQRQRMSRELQIDLFNAIASAQTQINRELKELAARAGLTRELKLTFHTARHSFADRARRKMKESKNISVDDIRQALGHTRLDTTQRYLNSFDREGLDSAMKDIFGE